MTRRRSIIRDGITAFAALALLGLMALKLEDNGQTQTVYAGRFHAVDGDTLRLGEMRLRLHGIDAPELTQTCQRADGPWPCGREAKRLMASLVASGTVECTTLGVDRYDRTLAACRVDATDLNGEMVRRGMALAYGAYDGEEEAARREGAGLWAGSFETPQAWRQREAPGNERPPSRIPLLGYFMELLGFA